MEKNTGGPAFPVRVVADFVGDFSYGMNLRDYFAAQALTGLIACPTVEAPNGECATDYLSMTAYAYADAMLVKRVAK